MAKYANKNMIKIKFDHQNLGINCSNWWNKSQWGENMRGLFITAFLRIKAYAWLLIISYNSVEINLLIFVENIQIKFLYWKILMASFK